MSSLDHDEPAATESVVEAEDRRESPENPQPRAWVSLLLFAGFVVVMAGCSGIFNLF